MSGIVNVRAALETALSAMSPALATAFENVAYTPVANTPYQRVNLLAARPENSEIGPDYTERGIFQVTLSYPSGSGPADAAARAEALRATFRRGATFTSGGVTVLITDTPEIVPAYVDPDTQRYEVPVRVRWEAQISA